MSWTMWPPASILKIISLPKRKYLSGSHGAVSCTNAPHTLENIREESWFLLESSSGTTLLLTRSRATEWTQQAFHPSAFA